MERRTYSFLPFATRCVLSEQDVRAQFEELQQHAVVTIETWLRQLPDHSKTDHAVRIAQPGVTTITISKLLIDDWLNWKRELQERASEETERRAEKRANTQLMVAVVAGLASVVIAVSSVLNLLATLEIRAATERSGKVEASIPLEGE